ncbi:hypothetical protein [Nocardia albiluteola]|uniref:hypothetical protein n=1 Tax=Nocardia albiluteola TaxID=2842303 RepID=UPI001FD9461E|nr:hypothetical protein [Nocardia albiluteola]
MGTLDDPAPAAPAPALTAPVASFVTTQEALERCRRYRKENGLYGMVEPHLGRIMLEIGAIGAVTVPAALGTRVRERLRANGEPGAAPHGRCGPIIGHPRSSRWTFLTAHADESVHDTAVLAALYREYAGLALPGTRIVLPSPADERTGYRVWIDSPEGHFRPDLAEVIAAIRDRH